MAEKKIGDILIGLLFLIFFSGSFFSIINSFDGQFGNSEGYNDSLNLIYNNLTDNYEITEQDLQQNTFNGSSFSIPVASDVDVRGTSQAFLTAKNSPSTIKLFLDNMVTYLLLHKVIITLISSLIIVIVIILILRFLRPGGA